MLMFFPDVHGIHINTSFPLSYQNVIKPLSKAKKERLQPSTLVTFQWKPFFSFTSLATRLRIFTAENGTGGSPCDLKVRKVVAALFKGWHWEKLVQSDGSREKSWKSKSFVC